MKLHAQRPTQFNTVTAYGPGYIEVNGERHGGHLIVAPAAVLAWNVAGFEQLQPRDFDAVLELEPELVLLGTGARHRFAGGPLMAHLARSGVGLESMDTQAACRTYNILLSDGRRVAGAFLQEQEENPA